eukprot:25680_1
MALPKATVLTVVTVITSIDNIDQECRMRLKIPERSTFDDAMTLVTKLCKSRMIGIINRDTSRVINKQRKRKKKIDKQRGVTRDEIKQMAAQ